jgi:hypothetical protein
MMPRVVREPIPLNAYLYPEVLCHSLVDDIMRAINDFHHVSTIFPALILIFVIHHTPRQERRDLEWGLLYLMAPYFFLLMILKYRAAYHRKSYKGQGLAKCIRNGSISWGSLKTTLRPEAKVSPIDDPIISDIWGVLCYVTVSIVFPLRITLAYLLISLLCPGIYELIALWCGTRSVNADNLVYNGRRYKCVERGYRCVKIQDADQSVLYFSIMDLHGLIPPETE